MDLKYIWKKILTKKIHILLKKSDYFWDNVKWNQRKFSTEKASSTDEGLSLLSAENCDAERKTYPRFSEVGELQLIISGQTRMGWNTSFAVFWQLQHCLSAEEWPCACVWPCQSQPYSKLRFRGHHHGLHWHNTITALFQRAKEFLGMRWTSICLLQLSLPLFLLLTLLGYHLAGFSSALQLPDLMDMATGWRCGITSLLPTVYLLIEVFKYYNPSVGVLFRHWC